MTIILKSTMTCPKCGHRKEEQMPTDACQFFYKCESCNTILKPKEGDAGYIFKSKKGTIYSKQSINRLMKLHFKNEANVSNISSHSLRKSFGNRIYVSHGKTDGILHLLSEMFNHSSISITRKYLGIKQEQYDNIYLSL